MEGHGVDALNGGLLYDVALLPYQPDVLGKALCGAHPRGGCRFCVLACFEAGGKRPRRRGAGVVHRSDTHRNPLDSPPRRVDGQWRFEEVGKTGIGRITSQLRVLYTVGYTAIAHVR